MSRVCPLKPVNLFFQQLVDSYCFDRRENLEDVYFVSDKVVVLIITETEFRFVFDQVLLQQPGGRRVLLYRDEVHSVNLTLEYQNEQPGVIVNSKVGCVSYVDSYNLFTSGAEAKYMRVIKPSSGNMQDMLKAMRAELQKKVEAGGVGYLCQREVFRSKLLFDLDQVRQQLVLLVEEEKTFYFDLTLDDVVYYCLNSDNQYTVLLTNLDQLPAKKKLMYPPWELQKTREVPGDATTPHKMRYLAWQFGVLLLWVALQLDFDTDDRNEQLTPRKDVADLFNTYFQSSEANVADVEGEEPLLLGVISDYIFEILQVNGAFYFTPSGNNPTPLHQSLLAEVEGVKPASLPSTIQKELVTSYRSFLEARAASMGLSLEVPSQLVITLPANQNFIDFTEEEPELRAYTASTVKILVPSGLGSGAEEKN